MNLSMTEQLAYSTTRIVAKVGKQTRSGTGFFFRFDFGRATVTVLVTNKHVVQGAKEATLVFSSFNDDGSVNNQARVIVEIEDIETEFIGHPDPNVDLAIMFVNNMRIEAEKMGRKPFYLCLDESMIPSPSQVQELSLVEDILMVGYPIGLWDEVNNAPIFRRGITATHVANDFKGQKRFVIDAACFPGSSGSPVFLCNQGGWGSKDGNWTAGNRLFFLGILFSGPRQTNKGTIEVVTIPTSNVPVPVLGININLGYVIKASCLLDFREIILERLGEDK